MALQLVPATAADRTRIARIRAPVGTGRFVHRNWFWLDRARADPAIRFVLIRGGARGGITGCLAYGPHERIDLDPGHALLRLEVWSHHFVESRAKWENLQDDVLRRVTYAVYIEALRRGGGDLSDQRNEPTVDQLIARGWARLLAGSDWVLFDEAGPAFREALRREPESATGMIGLAAFYVLAVSELKLAREPYLAEAENLLRRALARHPYNHSVHYYLGIVHFLHGNMPAALQAFDQALEINPSFPPGYARRGRVLIMLQKYQEALDSIRYALRLNGVTIVAGWQLWAGLAELELAQDNEARQSLQKVVAALPQNPYVRASLAALHALSGEWPEARRQVETLRSRTPQLSDQQRLFRFNAGQESRCRTGWATAFALRSRRIPRPNSLQTWLGGQKTLRRYCMDPAATLLRVALS